MVSRLRQQALSAYRIVLRAQHKCFRNDPAVINAARFETRKHFEANREETDPSEIQYMIDQAIDLAEFLKTNIVQLQRKDNGVYSMMLTQDQASATTSSASK